MESPQKRRRLDRLLSPDQYIRKILHYIPNVIINIIFCYLEPVSMNDIKNMISKFNLESDSKVQIYKITNHEAATLAFCLQSNSYVACSCLILNMRELRDIEVTTVLYSLESNSTLINFEVDIKKISNLSGIALQRAISTNLSLTKLDLHVTEMSQLAMFAIGKGLETNISLKILHSYKNSCDDETMETIGHSLKMNSTLTEFWAFENNISSLGAASIGNSLKVNSALITLNLSYNNINDIGVKYIANGLKENITLTKLWLDKNQISDVGGTYIAACLAINSRLKYLSLDDNLISDVAAEDIAHMMKVNNSLTFLSLNGNNMTEKGLNGLKKSKENNMTSNIGWNISIDFMSAVYGSGMNNQLTYFDKWKLSRNPLFNDKMYKLYKIRERINPRPSMILRGN